MSDSPAQSAPAERAQLLYELGCAFAARLDLDELIPLVLRQCREVLRAEGAAVLLFDPVRNELHFPYVADEDPTVAAELRQLRFPADRGIAGAVLRDGQPLRVDDVANDPRFYGGVDRRTQLTTRAMLSAPLTGRRGAIGVLQVLNPLHGGAFTDGDLAFLGALAGSVAVAIDNAQLYAEIKAAAAELERRVEERTAELQEKNRVLAETQAQLVAQEKLAALGGLTAGIAHELKNPLNFVANFAELSADLIDEVRVGLEALPADADARAALDDLQQNLARIREHSGRADGIVTAMLQHTPDKPGAPQPSDLNQLFTDAVARAAQTVRGPDPAAEISIERALDAAVGLVDLVPRDVSRALYNIANNGCFAVVEKLRRLGPPFVPALRITSRALPDRVELRVRDNGDGIPSNLRERVLEPFFTTKPAGIGAGLGLSIANDILAHQHRGELRIESEEGEYTEVIVVLPRPGVGAPA